MVSSVKAARVIRAATIADWQAAQILIVLWRIEHYQLCWTQVVAQRRELGKFVNVNIPTFESHPNEKRRLWFDDYSRGLQKMPKAGRIAALSYIEAREHDALLYQNVTTGVYELVTTPQLETAMGWMSDWLGYVIGDDISGAGWYQHRREWHYVTPNGLTSCGGYQIHTREQLLEQPEGSAVCPRCKQKRQSA